MNKIVVAFLLIIAAESGYSACLPGKQAKVVSRPRMKEINSKQVEMAWFGLVKNIECVKSFTVNYWPTNVSKDIKRTWSGKGNTFRASLAVKPGVEYNYRLIVFNALGTKSESEIVKFKTSNGKIKIKIGKAKTSTIKPTKPKGKTSIKITTKKSSKKGKKGETKGSGLETFLIVLAVVVVVIIAIAVIKAYKGHK